MNEPELQIVDLDQIEIEPDAMIDWADYWAATELLKELDDETELD